MLALSSEESARLLNLRRFAMLLEIFAESLVYHGRIMKHSGDVVDAELHWYEAHGIGKRWMKVKRYLS
jgi:hypothetical protein